MTDENPNQDDAPEKEQRIPAAGIDPREIAQIARLNDVLNREGFEVSSIGGIAPTDYGVMVDVSLYVQTREPPANVQEPPEEGRAEDAGDVDADEDEVDIEFEDDPDESDE